MPTNKKQSRADELARQAREEQKREREEAQRELQARILTEDDGENVGDEVSTVFSYLDIPVGRAVTGVFVELKPMRNRFDEKHPQLRPVLLVGNETVVLRSHAQLVSAFQKIAIGSTVRVACTERVQVEGQDQDAYRYRVSAVQPGGEPF